MLRGERIRVRGIVQGVGFRPTAWRLAKAQGLTGRVWNDAGGVVVEVWGEPAVCDRFVHALKQDAPPLAVIEAVERTPLVHGAPPDDFQIVVSHDGEMHTGVAPDAATCKACLREVLDPADRRYRYPFTNCTHCGPRLSIVRRIPYDRANTSMAAFPMCPACRSEYDDPADRRFHAQPNACSACGPRVWLEDAAGTVAPTEDAIAAAARLLCEGRIVAIKGIGGIHLACDAADAEGVRRLRIRKQRSRKAFALMARDLHQIQRHARLDDGARAVLSSSAAPIVILPKAGIPLAEGVAPGQDTLGFMLPYTPLHHVLMQHMQRPIVLTSGNLSDAPQCIGNDEARARLHGVADHFLLHDREIATRLDDSVVRIMDGAPRMLRRARGHAPRPIPLPAAFRNAPRILAMGGELKSTFCLLRDGQAILSQHLGDLEEAATLREYRRMIQHYRRLFDFDPERIVVDRHPGYLSTQVGRALADELGIPLVEAQHHHAHIAACMAEAGIRPEDAPVLGVALDGLGYGGDGTLWGGEFLLADYRRYRRLAHFQPVPMPGGAKAIHEPWRNTFAHLATVLEWDTVRARYGGLELIRFLEDRPLDTLIRMMERGVNSPLASSAGRLFDAVAAALGVCRERATYEGEAAIQLEALSAPHVDDPAAAGYPVQLRARQLDVAPLWQALLNDLEQGADPGLIGARVHNGVATAIAATADALCREHGLDTVALGGGVFQNRLLLEGVGGRLRQGGRRVLAPRQAPANDGGLSLGQVAVGCCRY